MSSMLRFRSLVGSELGGTLATFVYLFYIFIMPTNDCKKSNLYTSAEFKGLGCCTVVGGISAGRVAVTLAVDGS